MADTRHVVFPKQGEPFVVKSLFRGLRYLQNHGGVIKPKRCA